MNLQPEVAKLPARRLLRITAASWGLQEIVSKAQSTTSKSIDTTCMPPSPSRPLTHPRFTHPQLTTPQHTSPAHPNPHPDPSNLINPKFVPLAADRRP